MYKTDTLEPTYIDEIRLFYQNAIKDLTPDQLHKFHKTVFKKYVYCTNAIEGNTLNETEAESLIVDGVISANKSHNELNYV
ncbi:MAG: hypothetical protein WA667_30165 [Candidatus Nitrosopolaris sp.]